MYKYFRIIIVLVLLPFLIYSCRKKPGDKFVTTDISPSIDPDYSDLTIPPDIAPMNFMIRVKGTAFFARFIPEEGDGIEITSGSGKIIIPESKWEKLISKNKGKKVVTEIYSRDEDGKWLKYKSVSNTIAREPVDPYLYYRILYPGYESWAELSIVCRDLKNFREKPLIENSVADDNCINCHSFNNGKTDDFLFHMRGSLGGTYFYSGGEFKKVNLKTSEMKNGSVYPRWHPSGRFVAFSSNKIIQRFHAADNKKVEVSDLESCLVLYDVGKNEIMNINLAGKENYMDTYPEWSPDGKFLYFCRAPKISDNYDYRLIRYNLYRVPFDAATRSFGSAELIYDASGILKSVAFPRISPDGKFLVFTLADYGCFPIWHIEADLYLLETDNLRVSPLRLNSDKTDSYHSWSSNSKWLVFSSKRDDGLTARPYIAYIDDKGISSKPFILPQKDPAFYHNFPKSFNIPEFSSTEIKTEPGTLRKLVNTKAVQAKWYNNNDQWTDN